MRVRLICAVVLGLLVGPSASQAQQVDTRIEGATWGNAPVAEFAGTSAFRSGFGQIFQVPALESFLTSFSFWMGQPTFFGNSLFRAHLATWDGATNTIGPDLFPFPSSERDVRAPTSSNDASLLTSPNWGEQSFTANLQLTAGATYVAYLDLSRVIDFSGTASGDVLAFRTSSVGMGLVELTNGSLSDHFSHLDAAFTATFSDGAPTVVPEPSTYFLLATGLLGIGGMAWIRRRKEEEAV